MTHLHNLTESRQLTDTLVQAQLSGDAKAAAMLMLHVTHTVQTMHKWGHTNAVVDMYPKNHSE